MFHPVPLIFHAEKQSSQRIFVVLDKTYGYGGRRLYELWEVQLVYGIIMIRSKTTAF